MLDSKRSLTNLIFVLLALLPIIAIGTASITYSENIAVSDGWGVFVRPYVNNSLQELDFDFFWESTNKGVHRKFVPKLVAATLLELTDFNLKSILVLNLALSIATVFYLFKIYQYVMEDETSFVVLALISFMHVTFTIVPFWFQPLMIEGNFAIFGLMASLYHLTKPQKNWRNFVIAMLFATIASLSFFPGNLIWIVIVIVFLYHGYRSYRHFIVWVSFSALVFVSWYIDYRNFDHLDSVSLGISQIPNLMIFVLAFLGSTFSKIANPAFCGAISLLSLAFLIAQILRRCEKPLCVLSPFMAVITWVILNAVFAALGRTNKGIVNVGNALPERYLMYSALYFVILAVIACIAIRTTQNESNRYLKLTPAVMLAVLLLIHTTASGIKAQPSYLKSVGKVWSVNYGCISEYLTNPNCFSTKHSKDSEFRAYPQSGKIMVISGIARLMEARAYPYPETDFPIERVIPSGKITIVKENSKTVYVQGEDTTVAWNVSLPKLQIYMFNDYDLLGIYLRVGVYFRQNNGPRILVFRKDDIKPFVSLKVSKELAELGPVRIDLSELAGQDINVAFVNETNNEVRWISPQVRYE